MCVFMCVCLCVCVSLCVCVCVCNAQLQSACSLRTPQHFQQKQMQWIILQRQLHTHTYTLHTRQFLPGRRPASQSCCPSTAAFWANLDATNYDIAKHTHAPISVWSKTSISKLLSVHCSLLSKFRRDKLRHSKPHTHTHTHTHTHAHTHTYQFLPGRRPASQSCCLSIAASVPCVPKSHPRARPRRGLHHPHRPQWQPPYN